MNICCMNDVCQLASANSCLGIYSLKTIYHVSKYSYWWKFELKVNILCAVIYFISIEIMGIKY